MHSCHGNTCTYNCVWKFEAKVYPEEAVGAAEAVSLCQSDSQQIAAKQHIIMYLCTEAARLGATAMAHSHDGIL